ncbi:MAG: acyl carrier protein [Succinivibrio sp.]|jgi:acyl carrier protein|nr:acyl carrier protein [Succinivibrio sp.]
MNKEEILKKVQEMLAELFEIEPEEIKPESKLYEELELDSIDAVDLVVKLQKEIGKKIQPEQFKSVRTVADVVEVVYGLVNDKN